MPKLPPKLMDLERASLGKAMRRIGGRIARAIFGKQVYDPKERRVEAAARAAQQAQHVAHHLAGRAKASESQAHEIIEQSRKAQADARRRGDTTREQQARETERKAVEYAARQRQERLAQERKERDAKYDAEQAIIKGEQFKAKAREALLRTRKNIAKRGGPWPFAGPAPKMPEEYENINAGDGELPDEQSFLMGQKYTAFASSNVVALQFDPRHGGDLYIQFAKKGWYKYPRVGSAFALAMYHQPSKGIGVWDSIRVRGENPRLPSPPASTRKSFKRGVHPPADLPLTSSAAAFAAGGGGL